MHKLRRAKKTGNKAKIPKLKLPKIRPHEQEEKEAVPEERKPVIKHRINSRTTGIIRHGMRF